MNGFQITFITVQNHEQSGLPLGEWLLQEAKKMGINGGTLLGAAEGFGHKGKLHSQHFFELADQPIEGAMFSM